MKEKKSPFLNSACLVKVVLHLILAKRPRSNSQGDFNMDFKSSLQEDLVKTCGGQCSRGGHLYPVPVQTLLFHNLEVTSFPDALFTDTLCIPCIADHLFTSGLYTSHKNFSIFHLKLFKCSFNTVNSMSRLVFLLPTCIFYKIIVVLVMQSLIHAFILSLFHFISLPLNTQNGQSHEHTVCTQIPIIRVLCV